MTRPTIEGPLGQPPFERPSIAKAITNFVLYKFGHLAQRVRNGLSITGNDMKIKY
jgi:histone acetyltransferase